MSLSSATLQSASRGLIRPHLFCVFRRVEDHHDLLHDSPLLMFPASASGSGGIVRERVVVTLRQYMVQNEICWKVVISNYAVKDHKNVL